MTSPLEQTLQTGIYALADHTARAWTWWSGEMLGMLPPGLRQALAGTRPCLALDLADGHVVHYAGQTDTVGRVLGHVPLGSGMDDMVSAIDRLLEAPGKTNLGLAISMPGVLTREVELPMAAAGSLESVLRLDMDRQMPFKADDVQFAHRVVERHPDRGVITVMLAVAPKAMCALPLAIAKEVGLPLVYLGPTASPPWSDNLHQPVLSRKSRLMTRGLWAGAALLAALALWLPLERDRLEAEAMATRLEEAKTKQAALAAERRQLAGFMAAADTIGQQNAEALPIMSDITAALPLDGWLERLDWRDDRVEIAGHARATADFAASLSSLHRFDTIDYLTPVTRDENGLERFNLALRLAPDRALLP